MLQTLPVTRGMLLSIVIAGWSVHGVHAGIATGMSDRARRRLVQGCRLVNTELVRMSQADHLCATAASRVRRKRPLVMAHLGHGGGTFLCAQAAANCEHTTTTALACNCAGDMPLFPLRARNCTTRMAEIEQAALTFVGVERPIEDGEFCPDHFDYVLLARDPLGRIGSLLSAYGDSVSVGRIVHHLRSGNKALQPFASWQRGATSTSSVGDGLTQFDNYMVRFLASRTAVAHAPLNSIGVEHLQMAKATLDQFVTISELGSAESSADFSRAPVGWLRWAENATSNSHSPRNRSSILMDEIAVHRSYFSELNKWDVQLWHYARRLARIRRGGERRGRQLSVTDALTTELNTRARPTSQQTAAVAASLKVLVYDSAGDRNETVLYPTLRRKAVSYEVGSILSRAGMPYRGYQDRVPWLEGKLPNIALTGGTESASLVLHVDARDTLNLCSSDEILEKHARLTDGKRAVIIGAEATLWPDEGRDHKSFAGMTLSQAYQRASPKETPLRYINTGMLAAEPQVLLDFFSCMKQRIPNFPSACPRTVLGIGGVIADEYNDEGIFNFSKNRWHTALKMHGGWGWDQACFHVYYLEQQRGRLPGHCPRLVLDTRAELILNVGRQSRAIRYKDGLQRMQYNKTTFLSWPCFIHAGGPYKVYMLKLRWWWQKVTGVKLAEPITTNTKRASSQSSRKVQVDSTTSHTPPDLQVLPMVLGGATNVASPGSSHGKIVPSSGFAGTALSPIASEGESAITTQRKRHPCVTFRGALQCGMEWDEWMLARALIDRESTVLELGARFGTTSCMLANLTGNSGRVFSAEPDESVHADLLHNLNAHHCNVHVLRGSVSTTPLAFGTHNKLDSEGNYGTRFFRVGQNSLTPANSGALPHYMPFRDVELYMGRRIDTLLIDCEGCIGSFLDGQEELLDRIDLILLEEDWLMIGPRNESYMGKWFKVFQNHGLRMIWRTHDTTAPRQHWSKILFHSAWARTSWPSAKFQSCWEYAKAHGFSRKLLNCADGELQVQRGLS